VLANDIDYDGDVLALGALQVLGGSVTQNGGGSLTFTPTPDFNGAASIIYDVVDGKGGVANGVVSITVTPVNDAPRLTATGLDAQAGDTGITVGRFSISDVDLGARSMLGFRILDANGVVDDRFAVFRNNSATTQGRPGDYEVRLKAGLRLDYAAENADGDPRIQLTIEANDFETANNKGTANVTVTVLPGDSNRPPEATDDSGGTRKNESVMMSPVLNDDDPDGDTLTLISASALHGGISIGQLNIITYTPDLDYVGDDVITYTISDGRGAATTARVFMTVYEDPDQQPTHLIRMSFNASGTQGNDSSDGIAISKYGEEVAFSSFADNLVAGDVNGLPDIFLHDRVNGRNTLISAKADGTQSNGWSYDAAVSADGNRVAFTSEASNLVGGDSNGATDIFVKNVATGALTRVSTASNGTQANEGSRDGIFSDDGNSLAFESYAGNLVAADSNGSWDIFVKDLVSGATTRVSTAADGSQGNGHSYNASFTDDGGTIAFESYADNLVAGDGNNSADIFVKTLATGAITRVSTTYDGIEANAGAYNPSLSADGTLVVFWSSANNLVADDFNGEADIFIKNLVTGTIERVSVNEGGIEADGASRYAVISSDGQKVAFVSTATNLVFGDNNGRQDVFVKNLREGTVTRISMPDESIEPDGLSYDPVISATGDIVGFWSEASNIVPGDTNSRADIFLYDPFGLPV